jgi:hypothetical protein
VIAVAVACRNSETVNPTAASAGGSGGALVDGVHACKEVCIAMGEACGYSIDECANKCEIEFRNGGPDCLDINTAAWNCNLTELVPVLHEQPCPPEWPQECESWLVQGSVCAWNFGCRPAAGCFSGNEGPNGEATCRCPEYCKGGKDYVALCWMDGDTSVCDCRIDEVSLGMCDGGPEPPCTVNLWEGCCNQYFNL